MVDAVVPSWHGNNYQSRIFWQNAFNLLDPTSSVVEVTFEANGPKSFDDVVVKYDPSVVRSGPERVSAEYHQVKWHVQYGGRFGYEDFINPAFIGAKSFSLLERLQDARRSAPPTSRFAFITIDRIKDGDPLADLVSGHDKSLLIEKLFDDTTDISRMGKVRKLWREHLRLSSNDELRAVISGLRIFEGHLSLDELRTQINIQARIVGLISFSDTNSDFRYDELARQLKVRKLNSLTRELFEKICREEGLFTNRPTDDDFLKIAIRSFLGPAASIVGATQENTLLLTDDFRQRYLLDSLDWQHDIRPKVASFLNAAVAKSAHLRIILDTHASISFLAGAILDTKSGVTVELVQKGIVGSRIWRADDGSAKDAKLFDVNKNRIGVGPEIAIAINISRSTDTQAQAYIASQLTTVGTLVSFTLPTGPGQQSVFGGEHASILAEQVSNAIREIKSQNPDTPIHIFAACPNSFLFFLGQHHQGIAPCIVYEYDFDRRGNKSYQPSFVID